MSLRLDIRNGGALLPTLLASALGFGQEVDQVELSVCREFAFSARDPSEFAYWYLREQVFSKYDPGDEGTADLRKEAALAKFRENEAFTQAANERIVGWDLYTGFQPAVWRRARGIISSILGRFPWELFPYLCQHGPGATTDLPRRKASYNNKWVKSTHITEAALPYYDAWRQWSGLQADLPRTLSVVDGNRVFTAPKRYDIDRTCGAEPPWNVFLQAGVGRAIRSRLRRIGLLHPDAQARHQALARAGSSLGHIATLDLKAASDTVGLAVCEALLPDDWWRVILDLRSPRGHVWNGEVVDYAKVSSMGNGFTFELETLIFYALTAAVCNKEEREHVSCFGDDIICPNHRAESVIAILREAGFRTNDDKSFYGWTTRFRESCGGHFWDGIDVKPFYLRRMPRRYGDVCVLHNNVLQWHSSRPETFTPAMAEVLKACRKAVPRSLYGPWGVDGCVWSEWDEARPTWNADTQSYRQKVVKTIRWLETDDDYMLGGYLQKLWKENADSEPSWVSKPDDMEIFSRSVVYRDQWKQLPVRLA